MQFHDFHERRIVANGSTVFLKRAGDGPPVLLLHGFPETHLAWRKVAPRLSNAFTVLAADLPGYGASAGPEPDRWHERFSKRNLARTLVEALDILGIEQFIVVGHDRGARVAYRMALDYPDRITRLGVLDVISTLDVCERLTYATARQMANWFWLAQPSPFPEQMIAADPRTYVTHILDAWGGGEAVEPAVADEYVRAFSNPASIHAICEEFRAGDTVDIENDRRDRNEGRRVDCPMLVLWVRDGFASQFGDPITIWKQWADDVRGRAVPGGHFMMEESPEPVADALEIFASGVAGARLPLP
jgi:haloacetate dehalogenase